MLYLNTDIQVDALYTNYPFTHASTRSISAAVLPNTLFHGVHICTPISCALLMITLLWRELNIVYVKIEDKRHNISMSFLLVPLCLVSFVLNLTGVPCGIIQCDKSLYRYLSEILAVDKQHVSVAPLSFVFLPLCVSAAATSGLQALYINGNILLTGLISLKKNLVYLSDSGISFAAYSDDSLPLLYSRLVFVNNVFAADKHIVIKHNTLSDLRVVTGSNIKLLGVADV